MNGEQTSDIWYYADEETPNGPISFDELKRKLSERPDGIDVLVWRDGFRNWKRAGDVVELGNIVPRLPQPPLPIRTERVVTIPEQKAKRPGLKFLGYVAVVIGVALGASFLAFLLLLLYEIVVLILHYAFGIELPSPFDLILPAKA